jgi:hypothetical protein
MSGEDLRKNYILTTAANFFSRDQREFFKFSDDRQLSKFLDDLNLLMLVINAHNNITITTKVNIYYFHKLVLLENKIFIY